MITVFVVIGVMDSSGQKLNLKPQTIKIFAKDISPGNLILLGVVGIGLVLDIKIKAKYSYMCCITFLIKDQVFEETIAWTYKYDIF